MREHVCLLVNSPHLRCRKERGLWHFRNTGLELTSDSTGPIGLLNSSREVIKPSSPIMFVFPSYHFVVVLDVTPSQFGVSKSGEIVMSKLVDVFKDVLADLSRHEFPHAPKIFITLALQGYDSYSVVLEHQLLDTLEIPSIHVKHEESVRHSNFLTSMILSSVFLLDRYESDSKRSIVVITDGTSSVPDTTLYAGISNILLYRDINVHFRLLPVAYGFGYVQDQSTLERFSEFVNDCSSGSPLLGCRSFFKEKRKFRPRSGRKKKKLKLSEYTLSAELSRVLWCRIGEGFTDCVLQEIPRETEERFKILIELNRQWRPDTAIVYELLVPRARNTSMRVVISLKAESSFIRFLQHNEASPIANALSTYVSFLTYTDQCLTAIYRFLIQRDPRGLHGDGLRVSRQASSTNIASAFLSVPDGPSVSELVVEGLSTMPLAIWCQWLQVKDIEVFLSDIKASLVERAIEHDWGDTCRSTNGEAPMFLRFVETGFVVVRVQSSTLATATIHIGFFNMSEAIRSSVFLELIEILKDLEESLLVLNRSLVSISLSNYLSGLATPATPLLSPKLLRKPKSESNFQSKDRKVKGKDLGPWTSQTDQLASLWKGYGMNLCPNPQPRSMLLTYMRTWSWNWEVEISHPGFSYRIIDLWKESRLVSGFILDTKSDSRHTFILKCLDRDAFIQYSIVQNSDSGFTTTLWIEPEMPTDLAEVFAQWIYGSDRHILETRGSMRAYMDPSCGLTIGCCADDIILASVEGMLLDNACVSVELQHPVVTDQEMQEHIISYFREYCKLEVIPDTCFIVEAQGGLFILLVKVSEPSYTVVSVYHCPRGFISFLAPPDGLSPCLPTVITSPGDVSDELLDFKTTLLHDYETTCYIDQVYLSVVQDHQFAWSSLERALANSTRYSWTVDVTLLSSVLGIRDSHFHERVCGIVSEHFHRLDDSGLYCFINAQQPFFLKVVYQLVDERADEQSEVIDEYSKLQNIPKIKFDAKIGQFQNKNRISLALVCLTTAPSEAEQHRGDLPKTMRTVMKELRDRSRTIAASESLSLLLSIGVLSVHIVELAIKFMESVPEHVVEFTLPCDHVLPERARTLVSHVLLNNPFLLTKEVETCYGTMFYVTKLPQELQDICTDSSGMFWILLVITSDGIRVRFDASMLSSIDSRGTVSKYIRACIDKITFIVNQHSLLLSLQSLRKCSPVLYAKEAEAAKETSGRRRRHRAKPKHADGFFECPEIYRRDFQLFVRLEPRLVLEAMRHSILKSYVVENRSSLYVVKEADESVVYFTLKELDSNSIQLVAYGLSLPGSLLNEEIPRLVQVKASHMGMNVLTVSLLKHSSLRLTDADYRFIRPVDTPPFSVFTLEVDSDRVDLFTLSVLIRENLQDVLVPLLLHSEGEQLLQDFAYLYRFDHESKYSRMLGSGLAVVSTGVVDCVCCPVVQSVSDTPVYTGGEVPDVLFQDLDPKSLWELVGEHQFSTSTPKFIAIQLWVIGDVNTDILQDILKRSIRQSIASYVVEYSDIHPEKSPEYLKTIVELQCPETSILEHTLAYEAQWARYMYLNHVRDLLTGLNSDLVEESSIPEIPQLHDRYDYSLYSSMARGVGSSEQLRFHSKTRSLFALVTIKGSKLTVLLYNWDTKLVAQLDKTLSRSMAWGKLRRNLVDCILLNKLGLFHHARSTEFSPSDTAAVYRSVSSDPRGISSQSDTRSSTNRRVSSSTLYNTLLTNHTPPRGPLDVPIVSNSSKPDALFFESMGLAYKQVFSSQWLGAAWPDIMSIQGANIVERHINQSGILTEMHQATLVELDRKLNAYRIVAGRANPREMFQSSVEELTESLKLTLEYSRVVNVSRDQILFNSLAGSSDILSLESVEEFSHPKVTAYYAVLERFLQEYIGYLERVLGCGVLWTGMSSLWENKDPSIPRILIDGKLVNLKPISLFLHKSVGGYTLVIEVVLQDTYVCCNVYLTDIPRRDNWRKTTPPETLPDQPDLSDVIGNISKFSNDTHLSAFIYDFHLRYMHFLIKSRRTALLDIPGILTRLGDNAPRHARNWIASQNLEYTSSIPAAKLISYLFTHSKVYGFSPGALNLQGVPDCIFLTGCSSGLEYILIALDVTDYTLQSPIVVVKCVVVKVESDNSYPLTTPDGVTGLLNDSLSIEARDLLTKAFDQAVDHFHRDELWDRILDNDSIQVDIDSSQIEQFYSYSTFMELHAIDSTLSEFLDIKGLSRLVLDRLPARFTGRIRYFKSSFLIMHASSRDLCIILQKTSPPSLRVYSRVEICSNRSMLAEAHSLTSELINSICFQLWKGCL